MSDAAAAEAFLAEVNAPVGGEGEGQNRNEGQQCMARLNHAWRTEVNSPEILEFDADKADLIDKVRQSLKEQGELLGEMFADATDEQREQNHFTKTLYEMEIERVRYALARYLRARILKIEDALEFIIANPDMLNRLSDAENRFATRLHRLNNNHFEDQLSSKLPESCQNEPELLEYKLKHAVPRTNEFVFMMALEDCDHIVMNEESMQTLRRGDIWVGKYSQVRRDVMGGTVVLL